MTYFWTLPLCFFPADFFSQQKAQKYVPQDLTTDPKSKPGVFFWKQFHDEGLDEVLHAPFSLREHQRHLSAANRKFHSQTAAVALCRAGRDEAAAGKKAAAEPPAADKAKVKDKDDGKAKKPSVEVVEVADKKTKKKGEEAEEPVAEELKEKKKKKKKDEEEEVAVEEGHASAGISGSVISTHWVNQISSH